MQDTKQELPSTPESRPAARPYYYEGTGREHDDLMRCNDCGKLVTYQAIFANGQHTTPCCGTRRLRGVHTLTFWEWLKVRLGIIDFPRRQEFLSEFARRGHAQH